MRVLKAFGAAIIIMIAAALFFNFTPAGRKMSAEADQRRIVEAASTPVPAAEAPGPSLVRREQDNYDDAHYNAGHLKALYAGHSYPLEEAMTDEGWAKTLLLARQVGNRSGIDTAYGMDSYVHFSPRVRCKVENQPERGPTDPVTCVVLNGELQGQTVYATAIATEI